VGERVVGFRAPHFSLVPGCEWAFDVLLEEGYEYDSSLFPIRRKGYGYPDGERDPHTIVRPAGRLREIPPATLRLAARNFAAGGGAWFRIFPYAFVSRALQDCARRGVPGTFYVHPWEIDPDQPDLDAPPVDRFKHYAGLRRTRRRRLRRFAARSSAFARFRPTLEQQTA
jgi:polysaccharide deacetylase family protein (PEP-CTERM system associated)